MSSEVAGVSEIWAIIIGVGIALAGWQWPLSTVSEKRLKESHSALDRRITEVKNDLKTEVQRLADIQQRHLEYHLAEEIPIEEVPGMHA